MKKTMRLCAALGAFFVVAIAVAACGSSGVKSGDVASMAGNPISKQAFNHWMYVAAKGNSVQSGGPVIAPTDPPNFTGCIAQIRAQIPQYKTTAAKQLKTDCQNVFKAYSSQVMEFLIEAYWYQATAAKDGITVTQKQLAAAFKKAQKQTFPTKAEYTAFLTETGETRADIDFRLRVQTIFQKLIDKQVPKVTTAAEMKYYSSHASQFGTPETRDVELIQNESKAKIDAAEAALKNGDSWASVAKQYSTNAATKSTGGVIKNVQPKQEEAAVNTAIFAAPLNKLQGPIKGNFGYYLVEVTKVTPATKTAFSKAQAEIKELITEQADSGAQTKINAAVKKQWLSQTLCDKTYSMADCKGYVAPKTTTSTTPAAAGSTGSAASGSTGSAASGSTGSAASGSTGSTGAGSTAPSATTSGGSTATSSSGAASSGAAAATATATTASTSTTN